MSWSVVVEHENCGGEGSGLLATRDRVKETVNRALRTHNDAGGALVITVSRLCRHADQAEFVRASKEYLKVARENSLGNFRTWEKVSDDMCNAMKCSVCGGPVE